MDVFKAKKEVGDKYQSHLFEKYAILFCTIAEEVISQFGDEGRKAIINSVKKYAEARGSKVAKLVQSLGKERSLKNYFIYGDSDDMSVMKFRLKIINGNIEITARECLFCNACRDSGKEEYGKLYCEHSDKSLLRGYNPNIKLEVPSILTRGDKNCIFKFYYK